jgi:branched-chain amino acid transport system ATP-binding protein/neutral amino acid transport system ATP-binding protein
MNAPILTIRDLVAGYHGRTIVHGVSLDVRAGDIVTIIGPNGAGKSTFLKAIAGALKPIAGSVVAAGSEIAGLSASAMTERGIAYVPQEANVFRSLSVAENLDLGAWAARGERRIRQEEVFAIFPQLREKLGVRAGLLSGGQRQMVAFGMALMARPKILLVDEPTAGLSPIMIKQMFDTIVAVNRTGVTVLMVEQNAVAALAMSHLGVVMAAGRIAMVGQAAEIARNRSVGELYLGLEA